MNREFARLEREPFDLLVVGGGIYGAWTAYDAALRGLSVALVEAGDWSSGTSSASSKLIHGGLRYLEYGDFRVVRKTLAERRRLARLAPHRVRSLRFVVPVYRGARTGLTKMRLGLWLYDRLAGRHSPVEASHRWKRERLRSEFPFLNGEGLLGGLSYGDCGTDDARFTLEVVAGALGAGAVAVNHARAERLLVADGRVSGARVVDGPTGRGVEVRARMTAVCAGPWTGRVLEALPRERRPSLVLSKGVHLVMPALPGLASDTAFLLLGRERGRVVFLIPWYGRTLLGTTDERFLGDPDRVDVTEDDERELLDQAAAFLGPETWPRDAVLARFAGLRTFPGGGSGPTSSVSRGFSVSEPMPGAIVPLGGKYTSAREDSVRLVDRIGKTLAVTLPHTATANLPFPWAPPTRHRTWRREIVRRGLELGLDESIARSCAERYGATVETLYHGIAEEPALAARVDDESPFCLAEAVHAVRHEMALTLEDVLRRRLPWTLVGRVERTAAERLARCIAGPLGWDDARTRDEVDRLLAGRTGA